LPTTVTGTGGVSATYKCHPNLTLARISHGNGIETLFDEDPDHMSRPRRIRFQRPGQTSTATLFGTHGAHIAWTDESLDVFARSLSYALVDGDSGNLSIAATELLPAAEPHFLRNPTLLATSGGEVRLLYLQELFYSTAEIREMVLDSTLDDRDGSAANPALITLQDRRRSHAFFGGEFRVPTGTRTTAGDLFLLYLGTPLGGSTEVFLEHHDAAGVRLLEPLLVSDGAACSFDRPSVAVGAAGGAVAWIDCAGDRVGVRVLP
jgi:hypothetical protein